MILMNELNSGTAHVSVKSIQKEIYKIKIDSAETGMILAEDIYNYLGAIIIREETILSEPIIRKLREIGIKNISVYIDALASDNLKKFEVKYRNNLNTLGSIFEGVIKKNLLDTVKVNQVVDSIIDNSSESSYVLKHRVTVNFDEYLLTHSINVAILINLMSKWFNFNKEKTSSLIKSGLLHDIGKCKIDAKILNKRGSLNFNEREVIKKHTLHSLEILKNASDLDNDVIMGILMHHERVNGSGYPMGRKGDAIHEFAKIIAVADIYDAMTSNRVYRRKLSPFEVFEYIGNGSQIGLEPKIVLTFLKNISNYYIGDDFVLNNGDICKVIFINQKQLSHPLIKVGDEYIDLSQNNDLKISMMI